VLRELGSTRAWVVHADDGLDELSTLGPTRISELKDGQVHNWRLDPREVDLPYARLSDLQVRTVDQAADAMRSVLAGWPGPLRDIALLNAAAALVVAEKAPTLGAAMRLAAQSVDLGRAAKALESLIRASNG
jgi:anthranilate phosphoribosyltransferase